MGLADRENEWDEELSLQGGKEEKRMREKEVEMPRSRKTGSVGVCRGQDCQIPKNCSY